MSKSLLIIASIALLTASVQEAHARRPQPIENFTRTLAAFYVVLKQCSMLAPSNEAEIQRIRNYLGSLYPEGVPYWALPIVDKQIEDEETCSYLTYDRAISYSQARINFRQSYPRESTPPEFVVRQPANYYYLGRVFFGDKEKRNNLELSW